MGPAPQGGSSEGGKVPTPVKSARGQGDQLGQRGSFGALEESTATGLW